MKSFFQERSLHRYAGFVLALLVLGMGFARTVRAQVGSAGVVFLMIEPDSRFAGMGNAGVAIADNASAIFWNPAGLAFQKGIEASITHSPWLPEFNADLFYDYLTAKYQVEGLGTFGAHITYLNLGEHEQRDESNNFLGTFRSYDLALGGSFGFKVSEKFALGTSLRLIYSNLAGGVTVGTQRTRAGVAAAFDVAGLFRTGKFSLGGVRSQASFGFNLANMGPHIQYSDAPQSDPIPTNLRFGWSLKFELDDYNSITLVNDFNKLLVDRDSTGAEPFYKAIFSSWKTLHVNTGTPEDPTIENLTAFEQLTIGMGMEYWYNNLFAIRAGYFYENPYNGDRKFVTLGAGLRWNILGVDFSYIYALQDNSPLANTLRFSLLLDLSRR